MISITYQIYQDLYISDSTDTTYIEENNNINNINSNNIKTSINASKEQLLSHTSYIKTPSVSTSKQLPTVAKQQPLLIDTAHIIHPDKSKIIKTYNQYHLIHHLLFQFKTMNIKTYIISNYLFLYYSYLTKINTFTIF